MIEYWPTTSVWTQRVVPAKISASMPPEYLASSNNLETITGQVGNHALAISAVAQRHGIPEWLLAAANGKAPMGGVFRAGQVYQVPVRGFFRNPKDGKRLFLT